MEIEGTVLFIDDEESWAEALIRSLKRLQNNYSFLLSTTAEDGLAKLRSNSPEVIVSDLSLEPALGPQSGLNLISRLLEQDPTLRIIVLTGHNSTEYGIKALQHGAASFVEKPADSRHLLALIQDALSFAKLKRKYLALEKSQQNISEHLGMSSSAPSMISILESASFAASNSRPILLIGETGTGKGVLAQSIHRAFIQNIEDKKAKGPFIRFQPSFLSSDLVASELFGHCKGAFTGANEDRSGLIEEANGGTLFIDEVDEIPHEVQVLLLNVLQEKTFRRLGSNKDLVSNFRLIAATNRTKEELLDGKKLRRDFYHRIAHCTIELPPLRKRLEDIPALSQIFVEALVLKENLGIQGLTNEALGILRTHSWPGNIRELQSVVEGGAYLAAYRGRRFIEACDLEISSAENAELLSGLGFRQQVKKFEEELVLNALSSCNNNQSAAATELQIDRSSFRRILNRVEKK